MNTSATCVVLLLILAPPLLLEATPGQSANAAAEQELIALDRQVDEAQRKRDTKFLESVLTDDFVRVTGGAVVQTKADFLKALATPPANPPAAVPTDLPQPTYTIRITGDRAQMAHAIPADPTMRPGPATAVMHTWVRQQGRWKLASWANIAGQRNTEQGLNDAGYNLLREGKAQDAIELFKLNVRLHPNAWNTYDSLGEAYMTAGQTALAIENYEKSMQLNPKNETARAALAKLRAK